MNQDWKFSLGDFANGAAAELDDSQWETIRLPHTWNNIDGQDGTENGADINDTDYFRGDGWYRKRLLIEAEEEGGRCYLRFEGVNMRGDVYVNGVHAGEHKGGYTAFCLDITEYLQYGRENLLAVRVNNEKSQEIAPLTADFTFYGGIYRPVEMIRTGPVHFSRTESGARGLRMSTPTVSRELAECVFRAVVQNDTPVEKTVNVQAVLGTVHSWEPNSYIKKTPWQGAELLEDVESLSQTCEVVLAPGSRQEIQFHMTVRQPHLWDGRRDPFRYGVTLLLEEDGTRLDELRDRIGLRYFHVDRKEGFCLNGVPYPLRGVSRHQDREGLGNALTNKEHDEDFSLIYEIGATAVRLAHYPQAEYFYELCDAYGIVVWAEIPFVDLVGGTGTYSAPDEERKGFFEVTRQQLTELIRQHGNHPSIVCWGLQNEVKAKFDDVMRPLMEELPPWQNQRIRND